MKLLTIIAAISTNGVIGTEGRLPWHLPEDLKLFKQLTEGHTVVMGRKTWESLPASARPLPNRKNVVVTRNEEYSAAGATVVHSVKEALAVRAPSGQMFCIGGGNLYEQMLPYAQRMVLTRVHANIIGDTYFPQFERLKWTLVCTKSYRGSRSKLSFDVLTYLRAGKLTE